MEETQVCDGRAAGAHFGVDSCRACAAFFRRTLLSKSKFECASGACGKPKVCKRCRFDRCISSGMLPSLVTGEDVSQSIPTVITSHPNIILLHRLLANYKKLTRDRTYDVYTAEYELIFQIAKESSEYLKEFLFNSFQEMMALTDEEQFVILHNCVFILHNGEGNYRAAKAYRDRPLECFYTSYTTIHRHAEFYRLCDNTEPMRKAPHIIEKFKEALLKMRDALVPIFDRLQPTELEWLAAITLAVWAMGAARSNDRTVQLNENYRKRIFSELHVLYRDEFKLDNYAVRMGELMSLAYALEHSTLNFVNIVRLLDVFNVYEEGSFASEIVSPKIATDAADDYS